MQAAMDTLPEHPLTPCSSCKKNVIKRYRCTQCENVLICIQCYSKKVHPHEMQKIEIQEVLLNLSGAGKLSFKQCIQYYEHAFKCGEPQCGLGQHCRNMKRKIAHERCPTNRNCSICNQILLLGFFHCAQCRNITDCNVPPCLDIKARLKLVKLKKTAEELKHLYNFIMDLKPRINFVLKMYREHGLMRNIQVWELIQKCCVQSVEHTSRCESFDCSWLSNCKYIKPSITHLSVCESKTTCSIYNQLIPLCYCHARRCEQMNCDVPCCSSIKFVFKRDPGEAELQIRKLKHYMCVFTAINTSEYANTPDQQLLDSLIKSHASLNDTDRALASSWTINDKIEIPKSFQILHKQFGDCIRNTIQDVREINQQQDSISEENVKLCHVQDRTNPAVVSKVPTYCQRRYAKRIYKKEATTGQSTSAEQKITVHTQFMPRRRLSAPHVSLDDAVYRNAVKQLGLLLQERQVDKMLKQIKELCAANSTFKAEYNRQRNEVLKRLKEQKPR